VPINNNLANRGLATLLTTITTTTAGTSATVSDMSIYKWIFIEFISSGLVVDSRTVPFDVFNDGVTIQLNTYYTSYAYGNIYWFDNTHVKGNVTPTGSSIKVYGIK